MTKDRPTSTARGRSLEGGEGSLNLKLPILHHPLLGLTQHRIVRKECDFALNKALYSHSLVPRHFSLCSYRKRLGTRLYS